MQRHRPLQEPDSTGLVARAPYFHNGLDADLNAVVEFYDTRFGIGFSAAEKADLIAFLKVSTQRAHVHFLSLMVYRVGTQRQQRIDFAVQTSRQFFQRLTQPRSRVQAIEFSRGEQRLNGSRSFARTFRSREEPVPATDGDRPNNILHRIIVKGHQLQFIHRMRVVGSV